MKGTTMKNLTTSLTAVLVAICFAAAGCSTVAFETSSTPAKPDFSSPSISTQFGNGPLPTQFSNGALNGTKTGFTGRDYNCADCYPDGSGS
jgi:hypothetical protein